MEEAIQEEVKPEPGYRINTILYRFLIAALVVSTIELICIFIGGFSIISTIVQWINPDPWYIRIFK